MRYLPLLVVALLGCTPAKSSSARGKESFVVSTPPVSKTYWLTWSNVETWLVNKVDYRTNINSPWRHYAWVTNGYTNYVWIVIQPTNIYCDFRIANAGIH